MASEGFQFKQFYIRHDRCAMKVGTDGVVLGCWAITPPYLTPQGRGIRILDIGTGSGLIARMLMQRFPEAEVEAIDIDEAAVEQARDNGVNAYLSRLQDWKNDKPQMPNDKCYNLIVANPPYFQNSLKNPDKGREIARHTDSLSYRDLLHHSARLLTGDGQLALILPAESEAEVIALAATKGLSLVRVTRVYSKVSKPARRVLLQFAFSKARDHEFMPIEDQLVLEDDHGGRSEAYRELTKDFYL